jgi:predicted lipoprotein with Yx(FWY)xxD motif
MATRKIPVLGGGRAQRLSTGPARLRVLLVLPAAAAAAALAACSSSPSSSAPASSSPASSSPAAGSSTSSSPAAGAAGAASSLKTAKISGVTVLVSSTGFTLYTFAPDTPTTSKCNGACAAAWPPVKGPATAAGVNGTFATIKRSDGSAQATFDGHPLYTFTADTAPGQAKGNGLNALGGVWNEITTTGTAAPVSSSSAASGGNGY